MTDTPKMLPMLDCQTHGMRRWQGHVVCDGCGRVFQTRDDKAKRFAPRTCICGLALMPPESEQIGDELGLTVAGQGMIIDGNQKAPIEEFKTYDSVGFAARPICYLCFRKIAKEHAGVVPGWGSEEWKRQRAAREPS